MGSLCGGTGGESVARNAENRKQNQRASSE